MSSPSQTDLKLAKEIGDHSSKCPGRKLAERVVGAAAILGLLGAGALKVAHHYQKMATKEVVEEVVQRELDARLGPPAHRTTIGQAPASPGVLIGQAQAAGR